jgi:excisionase family DNA binding protein
MQGRKQTMSGRILSVREAAAVLNLQPSTVRFWIMRGKISADKVGGKYVILEEEIGKMATIMPKYREETVNPKAKKSALLASLAEIMRAASVSGRDIAAERAGDRQLEEIRASCDA